MSDFCYYCRFNKNKYDSECGLCKEIFDLFKFRSYDREFIHGVRNLSLILRKGENLWFRFSHLGEESQCVLCLAESDGCLYSKRYEFCSPCSISLGSLNYNYEDDIDSFFESVKSLSRIIYIVGYEGYK